MDPVQSGASLAVAIVRSVVHDRAWVSPTAQLAPGVLVAGVEQARASSGRRREIVAIASVTGTPDDPQDSRAQAQKLAAAGIVVAPDNRQAAALAAAVLRRAG